MFQPGSNTYAVAVGTVPNSGSAPIHYDVRNPASTDILYKLGTIWLNTASGAIYGLGQLTSANATTTANWAFLGSTTGDLATLTGDSGGAISASSGNINLKGTANQITVTGSGSTLTWTLPASVIAPGSVAATTTLTATLGNITATNGNLSLATAGNKIIIATGSNASVGTSSAMSGTPGVVTVATTACSATAKVFYSRATTGGTPGQVSITAQDGTGFTLTSTGNETSTFNWWIINA
jgi:hypothetical protein